jgi:LPS-assembly protein
MVRLAPIFIAILWFGCILPGANSAYAQAQPGQDEPLLITADEVSYDQTLGIVAARGGVEISQQDRVLTADVVNFDERQNLLIASGNVTLLEPGGDVLFAEHMELTGDFKDGIVRDLRAVLSDNSRFAANGARRTDGDILDMSNAVYSPCALCRDDPKRAPLWQIKAVRVIHDKTSRTIAYKDAWLELGGVPVAYAPYFQHPDPTVKRQSGFLAPTFGGSSELGAVLEVPYYYVLSPNADVTIAPKITSSEGPVLFGEYRNRFFTGPFALAGSITQDSDNDLRGHIESEGRFDVDDTWRWGFNLNGSSDDTYLRRYNYGSGDNDTLTSRLYTEGFRRGNYFSANSYVFQRLRADDNQGNIPIVLPYLTYSQFGDTDRLGGRTTTEASLLALTRRDGADTRRLSFKTGWHRPITTPSGNLFTFSTALKGDLYHVDDLQRSGKSNYSGAAGRLIPEASLDWRYPLIRNEGRIHHLVEPLASFVVSPHGGNSSKIPNEDSIDFEFDDTNLFSTNRFTGVDRVEGGPRFNYGLRWGIFGSGGGSTTVLVGQSYRPKTDDTFAEGSGLSDNFSDIVTHVQATPLQDWSLLYRGRWDKKNFENKRNELAMVLGPPNIQLITNYVFFDRQVGSELPGREEIRLALNTQLTRHWRSEFSTVRDLDNDGGTRSARVGLIYEDECFTFTTSVDRSFFEDRDIKPEDTIMLRVSFKTLGEFQTAVY